MYVVYQSTMVKVFIVIKNLILSVFYAVMKLNPKTHPILHYDNVIMGATASLITSLTIVYSTVYSDADQRKHHKLRVTGICVGNSPGIGEFPAQMASNAENVSIWWRHHGECWYQGPWRRPVTRRFLLITK